MEALNMEDERVTQPDVYIWYAMEPQLQVADIGGGGDGP